MPDRLRPLVIGTRGSPLALRQTQMVQAKLEASALGRRFTVQMIQAHADKDPELPLTVMSGEGVFVKELESALLERRIDLAVHSLKDLPLDIPPSLRIAAVLQRDEPRDALVSRSSERFDRLPVGSRIGTSSLRRQSQLLHRRKDLQVLPIRGNVDTRLRKLDEGQYDAIVVAACGLIRLGLQERITERLDFSIMLPEPGQGALAVEARVDDHELLTMLSQLDDASSRACTDAERAFLRALGGGCRVPIAAHATIEADTVTLQGAVIASDGTKRLTGTMQGPATDSRRLGARLAQQLISQGAKKLLEI